MGFLVINYYDKYGFKHPSQKYLLLLYACSVLFLNLFSESTELTRLYIYFRIFEIILVAEIFRAALVKKRFWLIGFVCCFYLLPYFRAIHIDYKMEHKKSKLTPYKSLLFKWGFSVIGYRLSVMGFNWFWTNAEFQNHNSKYTPNDVLC